MRMLSFTILFLRTTPATKQQRTTRREKAKSFAKGAGGATGVALDANIEINFSEDVTVSGTWFDITCDSGNHSATFSGGPISFTLDPDVDFSNSETCRGH